MTHMIELTPVLLPERSIPPPTTISEAARAALAAGAVMPVVTRPAVGDDAAWR